jgi:hypothetical protein
VTIEQIGIGVEELLRNADRLGLTWRLRPATVASSTADAVTASVIYDGDTIPITVTNLLGHPLAVGQRVTCAFVPPAGNYVIGLIGVDLLLVAQERGLLDRVDSTSNSAGFTAEAVVLTGNTVTWTDGRAYEVILGGWHLTNPSSHNLFRLRKTNLAGALIAELSQHPGVAGFAGETPSRNVIVRTAGSDLTDNVVVTGFCQSAATGTWLASATKPRYVEIRDCGPASRYPNCPAIV